MSQDSKHLDFVLVRYTPDAVKGEFVNIGVVLLDGAATHIRFTKDWRRLRALDPAADIETLQALEADLNTQLTRGVLDRPTLLTKLQDYLSNGIELTPAKALLTENTAAELETLARIYLERRRGGVAEKSGRVAIFADMKKAFEDAGVWQHMRHRIAASQYTHKGDPLKIDCGYRPNGVIKLFQAVSLEADTDAAKVLAFSYPELREGIALAESSKTELTAIVEPDLDRTDDQIAFALAVLARSEIRTVTTAGIAEVARQAREDLSL
jgi:hypothetical protein